MSTPLTGQTPAATYPQLLRIDAANGLDATLRVLTDGEGTDSCVSLSTTQFVVSSTGAQGWCVGPNGATNPTLQADLSTASAVTGLKFTPKAAGAGLALVVTSSGTNEGLTLDAKGSGNLLLQTVATGYVGIGTSIPTVGGTLRVGGTISVSSYVGVPAGGGWGALLGFTSRLSLASAWTIAWASAADAAGGVDAGLARAAAKVVGVTDGSTGGGTLASVPLSPAALAANQNDYNPGAARRYRLATDGSGAKNVTGLAAGANGQECSAVNVGTDNIVLTHQDAASAAANRFICTGAANVTLAANEEALLWYDGTTARWRVRKV